MGAGAPPLLGTSRTTLTSFSSVSMAITDSLSPLRRESAWAKLRTSVPSIRTTTSPIFKEECQVELSELMSTITIWPFGELSTVIPGENVDCQTTIASARGFLYPA